MDHHYRLYKKDGKSIDPKADAIRAFESGKTLQDGLTISDEQMVQYYKYANELYEQQNYIDASDIFLLLTQLNPLIKEYWSAFGNAELMNGDFESAFYAYQMAIVLDPEAPGGYLAAAKACLAQGETEAALDYLNLMEYSCPPSDALNEALEIKKNLEPS